MGFVWRTILLVGVNSAFCAVAVGAGTADMIDMKRIEQAVVSSKQCVPKAVVDGYQFCTGFKFKNAQLEELIKGGRPECVRQIEKRGYQVIYNNMANKVSAVEWDAFISSTKQALTYHDPKVIAFKKTDSIVDCIHELIHVFQWTETGAAPIAPPIREKTLDILQAHAEADVVQVEKYEKAGNLKRAKEVAAIAQKKIDLVKELEQLTSTLDEVEAHYFILQNCDRLKCNSDDRETALANLSKLNKNLPEPVREQVNAEVRVVMKKKKEAPIKKAYSQWKAASSSDALKEIESLVTKPWDEIATTVKRAGISVIRSGEYNEKMALPFKDRIPREFFEKLPEPSESEKRFLKNSKIVTGHALGKFVCKTEALERPFITLTMHSTRGTLVHEFLHFRQSQRNSDYCHSVFGQSDVAKDFAEGKIDRETHDQKLLFYQAINAIAELEVYSSFLSLEKNFDRFENMNNQMMAKQYADWLGVKRPAAE